MSGFQLLFEEMSKITAFFKRPSTSMTHATDNDNISPENAEPPNKKASKSGSRENTAYLKTVLHWKKDLGYKLSKLEGQSEVVEEIWCETCRNFSSNRSSSVDDLIQIVRLLRLQNYHIYFPNESCFDQ